MIPKRNAVALRHVSFEDLGLLSPILDREGWNISYCEAAVEDISHSSIKNADLLIALGGPIGVYEVDAYPFLSREIRLLEHRLAKNLPTLGICLGSQLMAKALGSKVFAGHVKEIGWGPIQLTDDGIKSCLGALAAENASVLHWHGDTFDLPQDAVRLAYNAAYENQGFSYGDAALALQFHLEAEPRQLEEWFIGHSVELAAAGLTVKDLRSATTAVSSILAEQSNKVFTHWLHQISENVVSV